MRESLAVIDPSAGDPIVARAAPPAAVAPGVAGLLHPLDWSGFRRRFWPSVATFVPGNQRRAAAVAELLHVCDPGYAVRQGKFAKLASSGGGAAYGERAVSAAAPTAREGETLCVVGLHKGDATLARWTQELAGQLGEPGERVQCNFYASGTDDGLPLHFDNREIFVLQLRGEKRWFVASNEACPYPIDNYVAATTPSGRLARYYGGGAPDPASVRSIDLTPGALLFLPRGYWHATRALGDSVSLTFGVFTRTALDDLPAEQRESHVAEVELRRPRSAALASSGY